MQYKSFNIKLAAFAVASFFILQYHAFGAINFAVSPTATSAWDNTLAGTPITLSNVLPGEFKENSQSGGYSNKVYCNSSQFRIRTEIYIDGDLIDAATGNRIPYSNLKYIFTYAGYATAPYEETYGTGILKPNYRKYVSFAISPVIAYESGSGTRETPGGSGTDWEFQFKYAVQVPNNQPPGSYKARIKYKMTELGGLGTVYDNRYADITINVGNYFRLSVDRGSIDFEKMNPGETKDNVPVEGVIITGKTNVGNPWFLKISNDNPLSSGPYIIPNSNFIWYGWSDGRGKWYGNGNNQMTLLPELMYSSGSGENNNLPDGTNNHLKFKLSIPKGQAGGKYASNVKITMTE